MMASAFDQIAPHYDRLWTCSIIGSLQREAVWRCVGELLKPGQSVLDLGCGTGEDAVRLTRRGLRVRAIDSSAEMVRIARHRGVHAEIMSIAQCGNLEGAFDAVLSNFGALNCVKDLASLQETLGRLVRPGGYLIACIMGRFCLWETLWALFHGEPAKAFRRWRRSTMSSLGIRVFYPSRTQLSDAFRPRFTLVNSYGIGVTIPPSYVTGLSQEFLRKLDTLDRRLAHLPILRSLSDHRLFIFVRKSSCH